MLAAVYYGTGDLRVEDVRAPDDPGPGQVLLRNRLCGICGTDLHESRHGPNIPTVEPHRLTGASLPLRMTRLVTHPAHIHAPDRQRNDR